MKRAVLSIALLPIALLLGSTSLVAQTTVVVLASPAASCPVSLRAQQMPGGDKMVVNGVAHKALAQMLHLTATAPHSRQITGANVTVRGYTSKARFLTLGMSNQDTGDSAKNLDVTFAPADDKDASTDISLAGFSAVTVVDLNSVTYADGSTWKLAAGSSCRSWIDGVMLVSSH